MAVAIDKENYTCELIKSVKDFSLNVVSEEFLKDVWICGTKRSKHVKEALGFLECIVEKEIDLKDHSLIVRKVVY